MELKDYIKQNVYQQLADMSNIDELCGRISLVLAETLSVLLNHDAIAHIDELKRVIDGLFIEAYRAQRRAEKAKRNVQ